MKRLLLLEIRRSSTFGASFERGNIEEGVKMKLAV
jgi:hypothetical protein